MTIDGGIRKRLISESVRVEILAGLDRMGWFDAPRQHEPLSFAAKPNDWDEHVSPNTFSITMEDTYEEPAEFGDVAVDDTITFFFDFYADSDALGRHVAWDVHSIVMGLAANAGRTGPVFDVYNLLLPTPAVFTQLDVEHCVVDQVDGDRKPWQAHWWFVRFDLLDDHADSYDDDEEVISDWSADLAHAWNLVQEVLGE